MSILCIEYRGTIISPGVVEVTRVVDTLYLYQYSHGMRKHGFCGVREKAYHNVYKTYIMGTLISLSACSLLVGVCFVKPTATIAMERLGAANQN